MRDDLRQRRTQGIGVVLICLAVTFLAMAASASAEEPRYVSSFGPDGSSGSTFGWAASVAVDQQTEMVYVLDKETGSLYKFNAQGQPVDFGGSAPYISGNRIGGITPLFFRYTSQLAVDSQTHRIYVTEEHAVTAFEADGEPYEFTAGPGAGTNEISGFMALSGVAVDAAGNIYASDLEANEVKIFAPDGSPITSFGVTSPANLAVGLNGDVYVNRWFSSVLKFTPSELPVTSSTTFEAAATPLDEGETHSVAVDPVTGNVYLLEAFQYVTESGEEVRSVASVFVYDQSGQLIETVADPGEPGELPADSSSVAVHGAAVEGTRRVYVAQGQGSVGGESQVEIFGEVEPAPPEITFVSATDVTATSAVLRAGVNPHRFDTTYQFEYGLADCAVSECMVVPATEVSIGGGTSSLSISQPITDLIPGTEYHFRLVAKNAKGPAVSGDRTFTTQSASLSALLADARVWELVSPPNKHGALVAGSFDGLVQSAPDGHSLTFPTHGSIEADPEGNRLLEVSTVLAARAGDEGWHSQDITTPSNKVSGLRSAFGEYELFSSNMERALLLPPDGPLLSSQVSEATPFIRVNGEPAQYIPLVSSANVSPDTKFAHGELPGFANIKPRAANSTLSAVVLVSEAALLDGAPEGEQALYAWLNGRLEPVSVLPASEGEQFVSAHWAGSGPGTVRHAVSEDGSRVFWSTGFYSQAEIPKRLSGLYLRDTTAENTVRLDLPEDDADGFGEADPLFQGASADGTIVFFTDTQRLTADASPEGQDLYRCEIPAGDASAGCSGHLTNISAPMDGTESSQVRSLVAGLGDDGSYIYFIAGAVLDEAPNDEGESATPEAPNLYSWHQGQGVRFVATLSEDDESDWGQNQFEETRKLSTAVSPNGRYLAFMSQRSLTGRDNLDKASHEPVQEVFRYDAALEELICASCSPTGGAPDATSDLADGLVDPMGQWRGRTVAAVLPEPTILGRFEPSVYQPRAILDNGRTYFNAFDSLVAADSNSNWDVYQYEPSGVGDCSPAAAGSMTSRSGGGCVSLISSGSSEEEAAFLDASASGDDVFFLTSAQLSAIDVDAERDVYDARVGGTVAVSRPVTECGGETCQQPPSPPPNVTPGSEAFHGPGNKKRCSKHAARARAHRSRRCAHRRHHRHKKHNHRRSDHRGRQG
jgi:DNA-binding beta-propeller fold protein YncE